MQTTEQSYSIVWGDVESGATVCAEENIPSVGVNNQLKNLVVFFSLVD